MARMTSGGKVFGGFELIAERKLTNGVLARVSQVAIRTK
jgi:hypothetical protein